jgi:signal transduction histidine kinase
MLASASESIYNDVPVLSDMDTQVMICHEFRTSMNVIMGFAQILGFGNHSPDEVKSYAQTILGETMHLLFIYNEFLSKQKISAMF